MRLLASPIILASASPRRRELLWQIGVPHRVAVAGIDERPLAGEAPAECVQRLALAKARHCADPRLPVLGADTEVVLGDTVYGKPADAADAARMLRELSGRSHEVITAVWVLSAGREAHALQRSEVRFAALDEQDIADYLASGEWQGKAGAYAIQGRAGAFIAQLTGSHSSVMGLPLHETHNLLRGFGLRA